MELLKILDNSKYLIREKIKHWYLFGEHFVMHQTSKKNFNTFGHGTNLKINSSDYDYKLRKNNDSKQSKIFLLKLTR